MVKDIIGKRFGRLVVESFAGMSEFGKSRWLCRCDCGKVIIRKKERLSSGDTKSCGCLRSDLRALNNLTHGDAGQKSPEYIAWQHMKSRCFNVSDKKHVRYGGRGITICERWMSFENFLADMGRKPTPKHSIDRINNDGNYEPSNCRWATSKEQSVNTARNHFIKHDGKTLTISQWADILGISQNVITKRLSRGWSDEKSICQPLQA